MGEQKCVTFDTITFNMNRFVFLVPAFNAEKTVRQMLASVAFQTYKNWQIIIKDDLSTDSTLEEISSFCLQNNISYNIGNLNSHKEVFSKVKVIKNETKLWETANVLEMLRDCTVKDDDICCRLDADDFLTDLCALQDIDFIYRQTKCDTLWTFNRWEDQFWKNNSGPMPGTYYLDYKMAMFDMPKLLKVEGEKDVYKWSKNNWSTSHLKTFRKYLINDVNEDNFKGADGEYIKRCGDRAIYYPVLYKSQIPVCFPKQTYFYHIDDQPQTYQTDDARFQRMESDFLSDRGFIK